LGLSCFFTLSIYSLGPTGALPPAGEQGTALRWISPGPVVSKKELLQLNNKKAKKKKKKFKNGQRLNQTFLKDVEVSNKNKKRCSVSLVVRGMQIKSTVS
jgi:hypothetical protein